VRRVRPRAPRPRAPPSRASVQRVLVQRVRPSRAPVQRVRPRAPPPRAAGLQPGPALAAGPAHRQHQGRARTDAREPVGACRAARCHGFGVEVKLFGGFRRPGQDHGPAPPACSRSVPEALRQTVRACSPSRSRARCEGPGRGRMWAPQSAGDRRGSGLSRVGSRRACGQLRAAATPRQPPSSSVARGAPSKRGSRSGTQHCARAGSDARRGVVQPQSVCAIASLQRVAHAETQAVRRRLALLARVSDVSLRKHGSILPCR
jgi:hypothetical protein